jgi:hypothetical protein
MAKRNSACTSTRFSRSVSQSSFGKPERLVCSSEHFGVRCATLLGASKGILKSSTFNKEIVMDNSKTEPRPLARALAVELTEQEIQQVAGSLSGCTSFGPKKQVDVDVDSG